jgi:hypothetical protein
MAMVIGLILYIGIMQTFQIKKRPESVRSSSKLSPPCRMQHITTILLAAEQDDQPEIFVDYLKRTTKKVQGKLITTSVLR